MIDFNDTNGSTPYGDLVEFSSGTLPLVLLSFSVSLYNGTNVKVDWQIATAETGCRYELQRSNSNGRNFIPINIQTGNFVATSFNCTDSSLNNGTYYYHLKITDKDGKETLKQYHFIIEW